MRLTSLSGETQELAGSLHTAREDTTSSEGSQPCSTKIWASGHQTVRNKCLLFQPPHRWCFVMVPEQMNWCRCQKKILRITSEEKITKFSLKCLPFHQPCVCLSGHPGEYPCSSDLPSPSARAACAWRLRVCVTESAPGFPNARGFVCFILLLSGLGRPVLRAPRGPARQTHSDKLPPTLAVSSPLEHLKVSFCAEGKGHLKAGCKQLLVPTVYGG